MTFSTAAWNLASIISEARSYTGRPDPSMMSDQTFVDNINYFYQFVLPKELKIFWGYTYYQFFTQPNIDQYTAPVTFQTLNPQVYADGWPIEWYLSPDTFYSDYPQQENKLVVGTGNGSINNFSFTLPNFPILAGSLYVTDGTQVAQGTIAGGFINPFTNLSIPGSINYPSGAVSGLIFPSIPISGANITATFQTYFPNRPA